jgi:hypothetical protein
MNDPATGVPEHVLEQDADGHGHRVGRQPSGKRIEAIELGEPRPE